MFSYRYILCVVFIAICLRNVRGSISKEDIHKMHESFAPVFQKCAEKHSLEKDELKEAKKNNDYSDIDPCFFYCLLEEGELLEDETFNHEKAVKQIEEMISDEENAKQMGKMIKDCAEETGENMGDGEEACKKALLLFSCFEKHKVDMD